MIINFSIRYVRETHATLTHAPPSTPASRVPPRQMTKNSLK